MRTTTRKRWFLGVATLCVAAGCDRVTLVQRPPLPKDVRVDSFVQQSATKIDVLWVVDNSGSMLLRQQNLGANFKSFIDEFVRNGVDYRIAVTTTDVIHDQGAFQGTPAIITPKLANPVQAFATNVAVGTDGSQYEVGMQAALMAIDKQTKANAAKQTTYERCADGCLVQADPTACASTCATQSGIEFMRPDAYLYIVFVTDEDDNSAEDVRYFWRKFELAKGIGNSSMVTTAAIIGDVPANNCRATPGVKYKALSDLTGGEVGSICDNNFSATLGRLASNAVGLRRRFVLGEKPNVQTVTVRYRYPCNTPAERLKSCQTKDASQCNDSSGDAMNLQCTPVQGGPDGWVYEPDRQDIYFSGSSVALPKAAIEIEYYPEGLGPT